MAARRVPRDVDLSTVEQVRRILERAERPVSRDWLLYQLAKKGTSTGRPSLNRALGFFFDLGLAVDGSKGIQWTHNDSESLRRAVATGRRLCRAVSARAPGVPRGGAGGASPRR